MDFYQITSLLLLVFLGVVFVVKLFSIYQLWKTDKKKYFYLLLAISIIEILIGIFVSFDPYNNIAISRVVASMMKCSLGYYGSYFVWFYIVNNVIGLFYLVLGAMILWSKKEAWKYFMSLAIYGFIGVCVVYLLFPSFYFIFLDLLHIDILKGFYECKCVSPGCTNIIGI